MSNQSCSFEHEPVNDTNSSNNSNQMESEESPKKSVGQVNSKNRRTWSQLKSIVVFSRKIMLSLNNDSPTNISFRQHLNEQTGKNEYRIYFLASTQKREVTIKYVDVKLDQRSDQLAGVPLFQSVCANPANDKRQLTKEEQLLRERKRCSYNGITSFSLDSASSRIVFSERSDLFYYDDNIQSIDEDPQASEISTASKGPIDVQVCPLNSNLISYVLNDNLYVQNVISKAEIKLTNSADPVKSGVPSYAVQEEFNRYTGYWWQPTQEVDAARNTVTYRIVYEEIDDGCVDTTYITPSCVNEFGYDSYRYPKAGTTNSRIYLKMVEFVYHGDNPIPEVNHKRMRKSFYELFDWYEYLVRGSWTPCGKYFWATIYDRLQGHTATLLIPLDYFVPESSIVLNPGRDLNENVLVVLEEISECWINPHNNLHFLKQADGDSKTISFITSSEKTGFLHLYHHSVRLDQESFTEYSEGVLKTINTNGRQLTDGDWSIVHDDAISVDEKHHLIYFVAYREPLESHLFVVNYDEPMKIKQLTQNGYSHTISMNQECNLFVSICSNLSSPSNTFLYQIVGQDAGGLDKLEIKQFAQITTRDAVKNLSPSPNSSSLSGELSSNSVVSTLLNLNVDSALLGSDESTLVHHLFKPPQIFTFKTSDGCKLYGMIYMPNNYEHGVKYPTIQYVYGGPHVQIVNNSYKSIKYLRLSILALLGYCVVVVDSRGSDNRGVAFEAHLRHRMGTVEISDQVAGLEAAASIFNCIDLKRVGIYGWSYGGYLSLMGLAQRPDVYKVAISGAPVTTWSLYDTAYTERYMGLPAVNKDAYNKGSVISAAKNFPDEENRLLIIHGLIDENVHFAHTRQLVDALIKENKPYQLQIYPNERHGIRSPEASIHSDVNFYSFLEQHL